MRYKRRSASGAACVGRDARRATARCARRARTPEARALVAGLPLRAGSPAGAAVRLRAQPTSTGRREGSRRCPRPRRSHRRPGCRRSRRGSSQRSRQRRCSPCHHTPMGTSPSWSLSTTWNAQVPVDGLQVSRVHGSLSTQSAEGVADGASDAARDRATACLRSTERRSGCMEAAAGGATAVDGTRHIVIAVGGGFAVHMDTCHAISCKAPMACARVRTGRVRRRSRWRRSCRCRARTRRSV
jgi:hypothetical protein